MTSPFTRSRACKGCNQLKVRCYPSSTDRDTCARCQHAGRECVPAGNRRRPRDRIADLEAQVAGLTKALQRQRLSPQYSNATAGDKNICQNGKRKVSPTEHDYAIESSTGSKAVVFLDSHVSMSIQQQALDTYNQHLFPMFPVFSLLDSNLPRLRQEAPVLLFSIISFATAYLLPTKARNKLIQEAMRIFALELISKPSRRLELVWALLIAASWFRAQPGISHVTVHQLVQLATGMAIDIGIGGTQIPITPGAGDSEACHPSSLGAQRAWLACFVSASTISIGIRRHDTNAQWTIHHDNCLANLSLVLSTDQTDRLFLHIVRGEKLCHQIATSLALCDPTYLWDFTSDESQRIISKMRKDIDDWTAEICSDIDHKPLLFCRYSAIIYLNEPVLHTSTNKLTFGSLLRPEKMAESDFPSPIVTGKHVAAIFALRDSCHAMLDLATESATIAFLATCPLSYVAKVLYALFILAKLYVSVTASGNTYGTILRPAELLLGHYFERMNTLTASIENLNPGSFNARILTSHVVLGDWFKSYVANISRSQRDGLSSTRNLDTLDGINNMGAHIRACGQSGPENEELEWMVLDSYHMWINEFVPNDLSFARISNTSIGKTCQNS
ncbi:c6 transcription factor [Lipomyces tetrasporus]